MKKIFLRSLILLLSISLVACDKKETINNDDVTFDETLDEEDLDKSFRSSDAGSDEWYIEHLKEFTYYTALHENSSYNKFINKFNNLEKNFYKGKENATKFIELCEEVGFTYDLFDKRFSKISKEDFDMCLIFTYAYNDGEFKNMEVERYMKNYNNLEDMFKSMGDYLIIVDEYDKKLKKEIKNIKEAHEIMLEQTDDEETKQKLLDEQEEQIAIKTKQLEEAKEKEIENARKNGRFAKMYPDIKDYIDRQFISKMEQTFKYFNILY